MMSILGGIVQVLNESMMLLTGIVFVMLGPQEW